MYCWSILPPNLNYSVVVTNLTCTYTLSLMPKDHEGHDIYCFYTYYNNYDIYGRFANHFKRTLCKDFPSPPPSQGKVRGMGGRTETSGLVL